MNLLERFKKHIRTENMIRTGDKVFVACSGGPDSVALFYLLNAFKKEWKLRLGLLHFNHGLRGREAARDEKFVRRLAERFKVPVYVGRGEIVAAARKNRESLEEAGRKARYDFFLKTARRCRIKSIALAHTQDDQAETIMMRILQGTGLRGLLGVRSRIRNYATTLIRPLLPFTKQEILNYLTSEKIRYCQDSSNSSARFLRNRVRLNLLPRIIREINPQAVAALARIPAIIQDEAQLIEELAQKAWQQTFQSGSKNQVTLRRKTFLKLPASLQFRVLEKSLKRIHPGSGLNFEAWKTIRSRLGRSSYRHSLPKDIDFALTPSKLRLYKKSLPF